MTNPTLTNWLASTKAADEAAKALVEKATEGPWTDDVADVSDCVVWGPRDHGIIINVGQPIVRIGDVCDDADSPNTKFIAASRTLVPQLLAEKAVLLAMVEKLIEQRDAYARGMFDNNGDSYSEEETGAWIARDNAELESLIANGGGT